MSDETRKSEQARLDAASRRIDEIAKTELGGAAGSEDYAEFFRLQRELVSLSLVLGLSAVEADEWARGIDEHEKSIEDSLRLTHAWSREHTPEELAAMEFAQRLAARQGTFLPDFDALYKKKTALDRKLRGT